MIEIFSTLNTERIRDIFLLIAEELQKNIDAYNLTYKAIKNVKFFFELIESDRKFSEFISNNSVIKVSSFDLPNENGTIPAFKQALKKLEEIEPDARIEGDLAILLDIITQTKSNKGKTLPFFRHKPSGDHQSFKEKIDRFKKERFENSEQRANAFSGLVNVIYSETKVEPLKKQLEDNLGQWIAVKEGTQSFKLNRKRTEPVELPGFGIH